jgi:SAM-dependent methyltransferase
MPYQTEEIAPVVTESMAQKSGRGCILCGGATGEVLVGVEDNRFGVPGTYTVHECSVCGLEQIDPFPTRDDLKNLYETYYNFGGQRGTLYARLREKFFASILYRVWLVLDGDGSFHTRKGSGMLLDIGCNEGRGLRIYQRNGFLPEGLELNTKAAGVAREAGFRVYQTPLEDFRPTVPYDVVVLSNVLEHSLDPRRMLHDIARILKPGGQVWISCPNNQSWLRSAFGRAWINWHVPFHIVHFSKSTLRTLLESTGFTGIETRQITPALWVASSIIVRLFARRGRATRQLRSPLLIAALLFFTRTVLFPLLYIGNRSGRGDCLLARAHLPSNNPFKNEWPNLP